MESPRDKFLNSRVPISGSVEKDLHKLPVVLKCLDQLQLTSFTAGEIRDHLETRFEIGNRCEMYNKIYTTLRNHVKVKGNTARIIERTKDGKWKLKDVSYRTQEPNSSPTSSSPDINSEPPGHPSSEDNANTRSILDSLINTLERLKPNNSS